MRRRARALSITALAAVLIDQVAKAGVRLVLPLCATSGATCDRLALVGPFGLLRTENPAGALGLVGTGQVAPTLLIALGLLAVQVWVARSWRHTQLAVGLIVGGAAANLLDRVAFGAVTDFIDVAIGGPDRGVVLNPADIALVVGAALLTAAALAGVGSRGDGSSKLVTCSVAARGPCT